MATIAGSAAISTDLENALFTWPPGCLEQARCYHLEFSHCLSLDWQVDFEQHQVQEFLPFVVL